MVAELFEYPFDLAKVRLQAQLLMPSTSSNNSALRFNGPLHCLVQTWREEGFRGLYRVCYRRLVVLQATLLSWRPAGITHTNCGFHVGNCIGLCYVHLFPRYNTISVPVAS